jgi:hypothetical protein
MINSGEKSMRLLVFHFLSAWVPGAPMSLGGIVLSFEVLSLLDGASDAY